MARTGIPNLYATLEVTEDADEAAIKKSYRNLVLRWHPDKNPVDRPAAEERIRLINTAYATLSNPTKRERYDLQRCAAQKKRSGGGAASAKPRVSAKVAAPKEFLLQPWGYPEKFVRCVGKGLAVQARQDAAQAGFQEFFKEARFSLWWVPDVNNKCRIRALGSKARGDRRSAASGLAGGLNLSFRAKEGAESEVLLTPAPKGQKGAIVDLVVKGSPLHEGAFRFEAACRRGHYLAFPPELGCLRVVPFLSQGPDTVIDFMLVDFSAAAKFKDLEEVLLPQGAEHRGAWVPLSKFAESADVKTHFETVLQKPVWDAEDFAAYFEGHWTDWEYRAEDQAVRMRPPEERLGFLLRSAQTAGEAARAVQHAGDELQRLPLFGAVRAVQLLAAAAEDAPPEGQAADGAAVRRKLLKALSGTPQPPADEKGQLGASVRQLVLAAEAVPALVGDDPTRDILRQRREAVQFFAGLAVGQVARECEGGQPPETLVGDVGRLLSLPGMGAHDAALAPACAALFERAGKRDLVEVVQTAAARGCSLVAGAAVAGVLANFDGVEPGERARLLQALAEIGACAKDVAKLLQAQAHAMNAPALAQAILAICGHDEASSELEALARSFVGKAPFAGLGSETLLGLVFAAAKNPALRAILNVVVQALAGADDWTAAATVNLLLAVAKERSHLQPDVTSALLQKAERVLVPRMADLATADLVKATLATSSHGAPGRGLLEVMGKEVVIRLPDFSQSHLLLVTQGLAQGLGRGHALVWKALQFWSEVLATDSYKSSADGAPGDAAGGGAPAGAGTGRLSADQIARFAVAMAALMQSGVDGEEDGEGGATRRRFVEAAGACVAARAAELPDSGRLLVAAQLRPAGCLEHFSRRAELLAALQRPGQRRGRSRSQSRGRKKKKRRR